MIYDFIFAALPWVLIAVAVAYKTASWAKKNNKNDVGEQADYGMEKVLSIPLYKYTPMIALKPGRREYAEPL